MVTRTAHTYMRNLIELTLCEIYARALLAYTGSGEIHTAILGYDPLLFGKLEALCDFGFTIGGHFGSRDDDIWHPSRPLQELKCSDYDLLILGAVGLAEEEKLVEELKTVIGPHNKLRRPVLRLAKLRSNFYLALSNLKANHFMSCLNSRKLALVGLCLSQTRGGDVVECGSFKGGTAIFMGMLLREWGDSRKIHTFDTFEGIPKPTDADGDTFYQEGLFQDTSLEEVRNHIKAHNLDQTVAIHKGLVQDTFPRIWRDERNISFALVDTDQYLGTREGLRQILPRLQKNGVILIDDYSLVGIRKAINEVKKEYPKLQGALITYNLYMLRNETDCNFLSHWPL
jgi:hypothetical protein